MRRTIAQNTARIATLLLAAIIVVNCTSDYFYGIEEGQNSISYPRLEKIAKSKEYIDIYQIVKKI